MEHGGQRGSRKVFWTPSHSPLCSRLVQDRALGVPLSGPLTSLLFPIHM